MIKITNLLRKNKGQAEIVVLLVVALIIAVGFSTIKQERLTRYGSSSAPGYTLPRSIIIPPKRIQYKCPHCNGRGLIKCYMCWGRGGKYNAYDPIDHWSECVICDGTGLVTCPVCGGRGYR